MLSLTNRGDFSLKDTAIIREVKEEALEDSGADFPVGLHPSVKIDSDPL